MNVSQNRYEIFLKVVELGNITLAAEAMFLTQSGVSHAIAAMEREAGCTLFHRSKRGVKLNENGEYLLPMVQEVVNHQRVLDQAMENLGSKVAGKLRVGSFASFTALHILKLFRAFQKEYPDVEIELKDGVYADIEDWILRGQIDCGFLSRPESDRLKFYPLMKDEIMALVSPEHPLAGQTSVSADELAKSPLISQIRGSERDLQGVLRKSGLRPSVQYALQDDIAVMGMVSQNAGVGIIPRMMVETASFDLKQLSLDPPEYRTIGVAYLPARQDSVVTRTFLSFCRKFGFGEE